MTFEEFISSIQELGLSLQITSVALNCHVVVVYFPYTYARILYFTIEDIHRENWAKHWNELMYAHLYK